MILATRDANANVTSITDGRDGSDNRAMAYDDLDRLVSVAAPSLWGPAAATFAYDPLDNLRLSTVGTRSCTHAYNALNRLTSISGTNCPTVSYGSYDSRGNVLQRGDLTLSFDRADRLTAVSKGSSAGESYVYDAHGRRVRITRANNAKTWQIYSQAGQLLAEQAPDGKYTNYVYLNGSLVARTGQGAAQVKPDITPDPSFDGMYVVSWQAIAGATQYQLLQSTNGGAPTAVYTGTLRTWTPPAAKPTGIYGYRVAACNPTCANPGAQTTVTVLRAPARPTASPNPSTNGSYTVSWTSVAAATGYRLFEKQGGGSWNGGTYQTSTSKAFSGKANGKWYYKLSLCAGSSACGDAGAELEVTVEPPPIAKPDVPNPFNVPASSADGAYTLTWGAAPRASGYDLEERFGAGGSWGTVVDRQSVTSWTPIPPKTASGLYFYRVRACNGSGCSNWTAEKSVSVNVVPMPTGPDVTPAIVFVDRPNASYTVSWGAATPQSTYTLEETNMACAAGRPAQSWSGLTELSKKPPVDLPASCERITYLYRVRACEGSTCSPWSDYNGNVELTRRSGGVPTLTSTIGIAYYHTDALGSPVVQTDAAGQEIADSRRRYEPYGKTLSALAPADQGPGYTGHVTDVLTGFSYMQQRYYDPLAGRFLSTDPVMVNTTDGSNFNRYSYANNNPYKYVDPDGRFADTAIDVGYALYDTGNF